MNLKSVLWLTLFHFAVIIPNRYCINLGLIRQIEVVEEWGCHDTEIRLTCGNLDSKVAILEATFTPNCTQEDCLRLDIKRLTRAFHSTPKPPPNSRRAETEAGRKFLETLRKSPHSSDDDDDDVIVVDASSSKGLVTDDNVNGINDISLPSVSTQDSLENSSEQRDKTPLADYLYGQKHSLRASLERLIIRYLRKLSPHENFDYDMRKRSLRNRRWASTTPTPPESETKLNKAEDKNNRRHRINLGARNITINETTYDYNDKEAEVLKRRQQETRTFCPEQQRKVSSMDRYDIERSYRNESIEEYNIRRILNRRCSGKNHCSFIFNIDHPFSKVWESGTVRVKYICMDDFRVNHYCGEHLNIGYELSAKAQFEEYGNNGANEPVAEALRSEAYHSLKILQTSEEFDGIPRHDSSTVTGSGGESRKRKIKIHNPSIKQEPITKDQKGIYSQDFRVLKILPSNLEDFNDLEKIGNEIYFRKDTDILEKTHEELFNERQPDLNHGQRPSTTQETFQPTITSQHYPFSPTMSLDTTGSTIVHYPGPIYPSNRRPSSSSPNSVDTTDDIETNWLLSTDDNKLVTNPLNNSKLNENYTITIREGDQYVIIFPQQNVTNISLMNVGDNRYPLNTTTIIESDDDNDVLPPPHNLMALPNSIYNSTISSNLNYTTSSATTSSTPIIRNISTIFSSTITTIYNIADLGIDPTINGHSTTDESTKPAILLPSALPTTSTSNKAQTNYEFFENEIEIPNPTLDELLTSTKLDDDSSSHHLTTTDISNNIVKIDLPESQAYDEDNMENFDDDIDDSDENINENDDNKLPIRKTYTSIQRTAFRSPLLHGFVTTPGYPKFYIGDSECKWQIVAPHGHKIRLTILDISLRNEESACMDFIEIVDLDIGHTLFNSCSEDIRPLEIISQSNQIEVIVKTTTKFAYPKRGVLIHYSALGCVNPPIPKNGRLINRTDNKALYECDINYIFPDTRLNSRQLSCTDSHTWNSILPDCIEEFSKADHSGFLESGYNLNSRKRPPEKDINNKNNTENSTTINSKMSDKNADMVTDIIIPTILITGLFIINGIIFAIIMKYRRRSKSLEGTSVELAQL